MYQLPNDQHTVMAKRSRRTTSLYVFFFTIIATSRLFMLSSHVMRAVYFMSVYHVPSVFYPRSNEVLQKLHGVVRPLSLKTDVIKKRYVGRFFETCFFSN